MGFERRNIQGMEGYTPGEQPGDSNTIKLNTNENPYPPSPRVASAVREFSSASLRRYPPPMADQFREMAASRHGLNKDNIIATRGGDELLRLVITTFVDPGEVIAMTDPTYSLYPVLAQIQDCTTYKIPLETDWSLPRDFAEQVNASNARLTFVVNPHAPSGYLIDGETIRNLAEDLNGIVLIDEAYVDFIDPRRGYDCLSLVTEYNNLIFLRTLSKGYSLAGLRFGYGIGNQELIQPILQKTRDSYNLDAFSQRIATAAFKDHDYARGTWQKVRDERDRISPLLRQLGLDPTASESNFLLVQLASDSSLTAKEIYDALKQQQILIRYFDQPRLLDKLRITVGSYGENEHLIAALRELL